MKHPLSQADPQDSSAVVQRRLVDGIAGWAQLAAAIAEPKLVTEVAAAGEDLVRQLAAGHTLLVAGNGGSAAIASHVAAEFIGKCVHDRAPLPAISLAESLSSITAIGNDYGYEHVFTRGVLAHARAGDVLLAMSTSGTSANVLSALAAAREHGVITIAMTGQGGGHLAGQVDHLLVVPSRETPRIQEVHMLWAHAWCEAVDELSQA